MVSRGGGSQLASAGTGGYKGPARLNNVKSLVSRPAAASSPAGMAHSHFSCFLLAGHTSSVGDLHVIMPHVGTGQRREGGSEGTMLVSVANCFLGQPVYCTCSACPRPQLLLRWGRGNPLHRPPQRHFQRLEGAVLLTGAETQTMLLRLSAASLSSQ